MKIKNLIFDFDGTLADTCRLIMASLQATIRSLALPPRTDEECRVIIGYRLEETASVLFPDIPGQNQRFADRYRELFDELKTTIPVDCYPRVREILQRLRADGCRLAVASSRTHASLDGYIESLGLAEYFDAVVGGDDVANGKPAPDSITKILSEQGWAAEQTMMVGDMSVDIGMGRAAGVATCGLTYGNGTRAELQLAGADFVIDSFGELLPLVE